MLCGVTLSQWKRQRSRNNNTVQLLHGDASHLKVKSGSCDVTPSSIDNCTTSDVTETEDRATVADVAVRRCKLTLTTSSFDAQVQLTEGQLQRN